MRLNRKNAAKRAPSQHTPKPTKPEPNEQTQAMSQGGSCFGLVGILARCWHLDANECEFRLKPYLRSKLGWLCRLRWRGMGKKS